jgi:Ca-activated chloride channel family protein
VPFRKIHLKTLLILAGAASIGGILHGGEPGGNQGSNPGDDPRVAIVPRARVETKPAANISVDVNEVNIPVTVTDPLGKPVLGLPSTAFHIYEDGVEQPIARLSQEDSPLSIGLLFDASASMQGKLERSREAVVQLLKTSMPGDEYFLVQFNDSPKLLSRFTSNAVEIEAALADIQPRGWTALLDALYLSLNQAKHARNPRRALVVLSDGGDNNSRFSEHELRALLRESDVSLYAIGMTGPMVPASSLKLLGRLAEETGGRMFPIGNVNQLPEAMSKVSAALREQYNLVYSPRNSARDGKYRRVQVKLTPPPGFSPLHASWRNGFYTPYTP